MDASSLSQSSWPKSNWPQPNGSPSNFSTPSLPATRQNQPTNPARFDAPVRRAPDESSVDPAIRAKLHKSANEFESIFVSQMLGHMMDGIETDETFGGGQGEDMFKSLLTNEYGKQVIARGGLGLADAVYRELLRAQEASHG